MKEVIGEGFNPLFFYTKTMSYFTNTSDGPYDRHRYKLVFKNRKAMKFDDYEMVRSTWSQLVGTGQLDRVEVLD